MIGEYKGEVRNKVLTALLQAYQDILDYDGLKSILKEAEMLHLKDIKNIDPDQTLDFFSFKKILAAQNCLLYCCDNLLFEIGRKFAFYLFPFGKNFEEIIGEVNELIQTNWKVEILEKLENFYVISVKNCIFCSEIGISCDFFKGFLVYSLEKTISSNLKVEYYTEKENVRDPCHNSFVIKMSLKKKNK